MGGSQSAQQYNAREDLRTFAKTLAADRPEHAAQHGGVVRDLLAWLLPPLDIPGRKRDYNCVLWIFGVIPAAVWLLAALPVAYTALVLFIGGALLLVWLV